MRGNFDEALRVVRALSEQEEHPITLVNSVNPYRLEGQKTAAFEVVRRPGPGARTSSRSRSATPATSAPTGAGSASTARPALATSTPAMWGFQAAGAAPLVAGHPIDDPETIATAIRIGNPASWDLATDARDTSGGRIAAVTDDEILAAYRDARAARGRVLRAVVGGVGGGRDEGGARPASSTPTRSSCAS